MKSNTCSANRIVILTFVCLFFFGTAQAATFVVSSTNDGVDANIGDNVCQTTTFGECTLRAAIGEANFAAGLDAITFNISGVGVKTIMPNSILPDILQPLTIDGYTQPGASANTAITTDNAVILIELNGANAGAGVNGLVLVANGSTVKGLAINRFGRNGILLNGGDNNIISGNFIGTGATGLLDLGNGSNGVQNEFVTGADNNLIGGVTPAARNIISGNGGAGISFGLAAGNIIQGIRIGNTGGMIVRGNRIGTQADGVSALGNGLDGILFSASSSNARIGGSGAGEGNVIAFNGGDGVQMDTGSGNSILSNSIHTNGTTNLHLGIDLGLDGVSANDAGDGDAGANNLQNFPIITAAQPGSTRVIGTLNSTASTMFRLEFFNSPTADSSGNGEGRFFVGAINVTTDGGGNASFDQTFAPNSPLNSFISATATNLTTNDTSEFSNAKQVLNPSAAPVSIGGRVFNQSGRGVSRALISLTDEHGNNRYAMTNPFGYYRFADVSAGETYVLTARHKSYTFAAQVVSVNEALEELNFFALRDY